MFASVSHFHSSLLFADKPGAYQTAALKGLNSNRWHLDIPPNMVEVTDIENTLTCYDTARTYTITNFELVIEYYFYATPSTFSHLIKALALHFNRLCLSEISQASLPALKNFCIYFPVLINL